MQIETYEIEEITGELGVMAADSESVELIEKLELDGQRGLANSETATRFPYPLMSPLELKVFSLLFPVRDEFSKYDGGIIPLRVLQVAAFVKENPPVKFHTIKVWHTGVAKEDPLLVGHTEQYGGKFYLLARWGDSLEPFEKLCQKAKKLWCVKAASKCVMEIQNWKQDMENIALHADELFVTGKISSARNYELENI